MAYLSHGALGVLRGSASDRRVVGKGVGLTEQRFTGRQGDRQLTFPCVPNRRSRLLALASSPHREPGAVIGYELEPQARVEALGRIALEHEQLDRATLRVRERHQ